MEEGAETKPGQSTPTLLSPRDQAGLVVPEWAKEQGVVESWSRRCIETSRGRLEQSSRHADMAKCRATLVSAAIAVLFFAHVGYAQTSRTLVSVADDGPTLRAVFEGMGPGDIVEFGAGTYLSVCNVTLTASDVKIVGAGQSKTIFNCSYQSRHFHVAGQHAAFSNLHLVEGQSTCVPSNITECSNCQCGQATSGGGHGGCVLVAESATFTNVTMSKCRTAWHGGGVAGGPGSRLHLDDVQVTECEAEHGGGIFLDSSASVVVSGSSSMLEGNFAQKGGAVYGGTNASISINGKVVLANNVGDIEGGALYSSGGRIDVANGAVFRGNSASYYGGAISARDAATVSIRDDVTLVENAAVWYGGAVYLVGSGLQVANRVSMHANAASNGGAIYVKPGTVLIHGEVSFTSHSVTGLGAVLYADSAATVELDGNVLVSDNHGGGTGARGAFAGYYGTTMTFRNGVVFQGNTNYRGACVYAEWDSEIVIENGVTARDNRAVGRGGVISTFAYVTVTLRNNVVLYNNTCQWGSGGSIYVAYSDTARARGLNIQDGVVISEGNARWGGGVNARQSTVYIGNDVNMTDGYAHTQGGALFITQFSTLVVEGPVRILRNYGYLGGALLISEYSQATMRGDVLFQDNRGGNGGAINMYVHVDVALEPGVVIDASYARWWGGAFFVQEYTTLTMQEGVVVSNTVCDYYGGAIHAVFRSEIILNGAIIKNNRVARTGGGIDLDNRASLVANNAVIVNNSAVLSGGGVSAIEGSTVTLNRGTRVSNNTAVLGGGGVSMSNDARLSTTGVIFEGNAVTATRADCTLLPCGGGAVKVADVATAVLGAGTVLRSNTADIGGGLLLSEISTAAVRGAVVTMNRAVDGGGIATVNGTKLSVEGLSCDANTAAMLGGCLYSSGAPAEFVGEASMVANSAMDGGGMFLYTGLTLKGSPPSITTLEGNAATLQGGAIALVGSLALASIDASHRLVMRENTAGLHGGAIAISLGAAIGVIEDKCPSECANSMRGDQVCQPECMSAACKWDEGDCDAQMRLAGDDGVNACHRTSGCSPFTHAVECHPSCFVASCDWHRSQCRPQKERMRRCPLYDAAVFASVNAAQLVYAKGGSVGGHDACANSTCQQANTVPGDFNWTRGAVGPHAISFSSNAAWLVAYDSEHLPRDLHAVTLDVWVNARPGSEIRGYLASWETFGVFVEPFADRGFQIGVEKGGDVSFSTATYLCSNGDPAILTDEYGLITDGDADYLPNAGCGFIIAPQTRPGQCGRNALTVSFILLDTEENYDFVNVYDCADEACEAKTAVPGSPFSGNLAAFTLTAANGVMQVMLVSDQNVQGRGFAATFDARPEDENGTFPGVFQADTWQHVSVAVSPDGTTDFFLDGVRVKTQAGAALPPNPLKGGFGVGQRFLGPVFARTGRLEGSVDELRVWRGVHDSSTDWMVGCSNLSDAADLLLCYGFNEGAGDVVSDVVGGGAGAARGVVGEKHLAWCETKDDDGRVLNENGRSLGPSWGFCSYGKPRLPGAFYDYDADEMDAVSKMSLSEIVNTYPDCGSNTLQFSGNRALGGNGGAVYQADCDTAADARGQCFFTGMNSGGGAMTLASFINNSAAGAGGAAYVECHRLGTSCGTSLELVLPFPLSTVTEMKVMMAGNAAGTRVGMTSGDVATSPKNILLPTDENATDILGEWPAPMQLSYIPGQSPLSLSVALLDDLGSLVVSTALVPNSFFVEVLLCALHRECSSTTALAPSALHRFSRVAGDPMSRTVDGDQEVVCPVGESAVLVKMSLVGASQVSSRTVTITCLPCAEGMSRQEMGGNGARGIWTCVSCASNQYVVDPNANPCQPCPTRSHCDGSVMWDDIAGSVWRADNVSGQYVLEHCPPGHQRVTGSDGAFSATLQQCKPCTPGLEYIVDPDRNQCEECPVESECDGSVMTDPIQGSVWLADAESGLYLLQSCPAGHQKITEAGGVFSATLQQCKPCTPGLEYIVDPNEHECKQCPAGAVCPNGSVLEAGGRLDTGEKDPADSRWEAVWEADALAGIYMLRSCPPGHQKITLDQNGAFSATIQQCKPCTPGLQYIVDPSRHECQQCPLGWPVGCDMWIQSLVAPDDASVWEMDDSRGLLRLAACEAGYILIRDDLFPLQDQCVLCAPDTFSVERADFYDGDRAANPRVSSRAAYAQEKCIRCVDGVTCPGGAVLEPKGGFWKGASAAKTPRRAVEVGPLGVPRASTSDVGVYPCPPHACKPGGQCTEGREGLVCGVCKQGWSMAYGNCTRCAASDGLTRLILVVVLLFLAMVALYVCGYVPIFGRDPDEELGDEARTGGLDALKAKLKAFAVVVLGGQVVLQWEKARDTATLPFLGWGKIIISFYQVLSSYIVTFSVGWPIGQQRMMENSAIARFDFMALPGLNCLAGSYDYKQKMLVYLMSVPAVLLLLTLPTIYVIAVGLARHGGWNKHPRFQRVIHKFLWMTLLFIFIVYPTVSVVALRSFACQDLGEFGKKLVADYRENCPAEEQEGFIFIWSLVFSIIYPAGIPCVFLVVMIVYRIPQMSRQKMKDAAIAALISTYKRRTASALAVGLEKKLGVSLDKHGKPTGPTRGSFHTFFGHLADIETRRASAEEGSSPVARAALRPGMLATLHKDTFKKLLGQAGLQQHDQETLHDLLDKQTGSQVRRGSELDHQKLDVMMRELMGPSQFSGLEKLDELTRDQLKTLVKYDWLRGKHRDSGRRSRLGSEQSVQLDGFASPSDGGGVGFTSIARPGHFSLQHESAKKLMRSRGSLFNHKERPSDLPHPDEFEHLTDEKLRNKVKDIAVRLVEACIIAVPHLEWDGGLGEEEEQAISHIGFLFKNYRVECWYYELLEITRKLMCIAVMAFIFPGSPAQVAAGFAISFFFLMVAARINPYVDPRLEGMQIWALLALATTLFYGLVLVVQETAPRPLSDGWMSFLDTMFQIINFSILFYPLFQIYFGSRYAPREYFKRLHRRWLRHVEAKRNENPLQNTRRGEPTASNGHDDHASQDDRASHVERASHDDHASHVDRASHDDNDDDGGTDLGDREQDSEAGRARGRTREPLHPLPLQTRPGAASLRYETDSSPSPPPPPSPPPAASAAAPHSASAESVGNSREASGEGASVMKGGWGGLVGESPEPVEVVESVAISSRRIPVQARVPEIETERCGGLGVRCALR